MCQEKCNLDEGDICRFEMILDSDYDSDSCTNITLGCRISGSGVSAVNTSHVIQVVSKMYKVFDTSKEHQHPQ